MQTYQNDQVELKSYTDRKRRTGEHTNMIYHWFCVYVIDEGKASVPAPLPICFLLLNEVIFVETMLTLFNNLNRLKYLNSNYLDLD